MKTHRSACPSRGHREVEESYQTWLDIAALFRHVIHAQFDEALPLSYPSDALGEVVTLAHARFSAACRQSLASRSITQDPAAEQAFWARVGAVGADVQTRSAHAKPDVLSDLMAARSAMLRHIPAGAIP